MPDAIIDQKPSIFSAAFWRPNGYYIRLNERSNFWNNCPYPLATLGWRIYHKPASSLSSFGCGALINTTLLSVFIVEKGAKAHANIYIGKSWIFKGRSIGKTFKFTVRAPAWDSLAYISKNK